MARKNFSLRAKYTALQDGVQLDRMRPVHPGEILLADYLEPLHLTNTEGLKSFAARIGTTLKVVNEIVDGQRAVDLDMAMRLAQVFNTSVDIWLNLQRSYDVSKAVQCNAEAEISAIVPYTAREKAKMTNV